MKFGHSESVLIWLSRKTIKNVQKIHKKEIS